MAQAFIDNLAPGSADDGTIKTYERIAPVYDLLDAVYEWSWKRQLRAELFRHARGRLLDVGVGTGCNIPFYPDGADAVGIDISRLMLERAAKRAKALDRPVQLHRMILMDLSIHDHSFDTVVATFVLLCLPDDLQLAALRELRRICKPDGTLLLLDYRMSDQKGMQIWMRLVEPWLRWAFAGRYDAQTDHYLRDAGFVCSYREALLHGSVGLTLARPLP